MSDTAPIKPICFMVMPFGVKDVPGSPGHAPAKIDFDELWKKAISPALERLGYDPVRADQETGALIIHEMLERLYYADLVVADMSIPNGNVYYEIGVRHAAKPDNCVLISADWSVPLFDTQQMRRVAYPLPDMKVSAEQAAVIADCLEKGIPALREGSSPMFEVMPGYPSPNPERALTMRRELEKFANFNAELRAISLIDDRAESQALARALVQHYPASEQLQASVAVAIVQLLRDEAGWTDMQDYIEALPAPLRELAYMREQNVLAQSKSGDHRQAIAALEALNEMLGESSERLGLLGGRYKKLAQAAEIAGDLRTARKTNESAIDYYERGMRLQLGDFYCASNLARLYRERGDEEDEGRAKFAHQLTVMMVESAIERRIANEWAMATLLGAAFDAGDVTTARAAVKKLAREDLAHWKLETTVSDLTQSMENLPDADTRARLQDVLEDLKDLLVPQG